MAILTGSIPRGNCDILGVEAGVIHCRPILAPDYIGVRDDILTWYGKLAGAPGEQVQLCIHWPRTDAAAKRAFYERTGKTWNMDGGWQPKSLLEFAGEMFYRSCDELHWEKVDAVRVEEDCILLDVTMDAPECWLSASLPYTVKMYEQLLADCKASPVANILHLADGAFGDPMYLIQLTDPAVPEAQKQHVYLEAAVHCAETTGCALLHFLAEYLLLESPRALELLKKYVYHIVPVVDVSGWRRFRTDGTCKNESKNMNRDWGTFANDETRAIWDYLTARSWAFAIDFHGAWPGVDRADIKTDGAAWLHTSFADPAHQRRCKKIADLLASPEANLLMPGASYALNQPENSADGFFPSNGIPGFLVELAFAGIYSQEAGCAVNLNQRDIRKAATRLPEMIDRALNEK